MKISKKSLASFIIISFSFFLILSPGIFGYKQENSQANAQSAFLGDQFAMEEVQPLFGNEPPQDIRLIIVRIIQVALSFLALIFLVLILVSGFKWMTSGGNEETIKLAQKNLINSVIGLIIILSAWTLATYFIFVFKKTIINQSIDFTNVKY